MKRALGLLSAASVIFASADEYVGNFPRKAKTPRKKVNPNAAKQKLQRKARKRRPA